MEAPFIFGKIATDDNFTDREQETAHLVANFKSLINTILISPRRWGKSSLVNRAAELALKSDSRLKICLVDLFNVKSEEHFYQLLAEDVIKATSSRLEEAVGNTRKFISQLIPRITVGNEISGDISLGFDWEELKRTPDEVLDLSENIAAAKDLRIVVCIDEFQNVAEFEDPLYFQRRLRSHWQRHQKVSYCIYGSKRHMMTDIFTNPQMPFYKFGDLFFLEKIKTEYFAPFIAERFAATGKSIDHEACLEIISLADNHPYYVQQLAQISWLRATDGHCTTGIVRQSHETLVQQLSLLFVTITEGLTNQQLALLHAMTAGETAFTSAEVMKKYRISSSMSVSRSKKSLVEKDILDINAGTISFQDPIYAWWLRHCYFI